MSNSPVIERLQAGNFKPTSDLLLAILAIFLPPLPVFVKRGLGLDLLINVVLLMLGGFPGIIHAWYIIVKYEDDGIPIVSQQIHSQLQNGFNYQQIDDNTDNFDQGGNLENGNGAHHQQQGVYHPEPASHAAPQESFQQSSAPAPSGSGSSSQPPPYDPSNRPPNQAPGDNKIQYGSQF